MPAQCKYCGSQGDTERGTKNHRVGERGRDVRVRGRQRACGNEIEGRESLGKPSWTELLSAGFSPLPSLTCRWEHLSTLCHDGWNIYDLLFTKRGPVLRAHGCIAFFLQIIFLFPFTFSLSLLRSLFNPQLWAWRAALSDNGDAEWQFLILSSSNDICFSSAHWSAIKMSQADLHKSNLPNTAYFSLLLCREWENPYLIEINGGIYMR